MSGVFSHLAQPLEYAERLLNGYEAVSRASEPGSLLAEFACQASHLSGCEATRIYLLDAGQHRLVLHAQCLHGVNQPPDPGSPALSDNGNELLQYCLGQHHPLCLNELSDGVYQTGFLPHAVRPWRALLCIPLTNAGGETRGILACASHTGGTLDGFADTLARLGTFAIIQLELLRKLAGRSEPAAPAASRAAVAGNFGLIGTSEAMRKTCGLIAKVLHSNYTVLLTGETGTGKEVVARALHDCGPRRTRPFVVQNCAAFSEHLLESELFGYRKGAFTGADRDRKGLFDAADGGTLLLDEIGDMPLALQAKLLRVLQEREVRPLGATETHRIDVRIIAATHCDLPALVACGRFREDLYYRLANFPIELPPLRQRGSDVTELACHFAATASALLGREPVSWSQAALTRLSAHTFPGNVRELKGLVDRAVLMCEGNELLPEHLGLGDGGLPDTSLYLRDYLARVERAYMVGCLRQNGGNQTLSAQQLGLPRRTLLYRMGRLNIDMSEVQA